MNSEAEVCRILANSLNTGYKIPDATSNFGQTVIRPFDGIGMIEKEDGLHFLCWEAKYLPKMMAFSFKRVEPHQHAYLKEYSKAIGVESFLFVGVKFGRGKNYVFMFDYASVNMLYEKQISIHAKYLMQLPFMEVHKGLVNIDLDNLITLDKIKEVYGDEEWQKLLSDA